MPLTIGRVGRRKGSAAKGRVGAAGHRRVGQLLALLLAASKKKGFNESFHNSPVYIFCHAQIDMYSV